MRTAGRGLMKPAASLAAALALLGAVGPQESPRIRVVSPPVPARPIVELEWKAPFLPDGTVVSVQVTRVEERAREGALERKEGFSSTGQGYAKGGVFTWNGLVGGPGSFRATVTLMADLQGARALQALKDGGVPMPQKWNCEFEAWGDDLAGQLEPALREFDRLEAGLAALVLEYADAGAKRQTWRERLGGLSEKNQKLVEEIGRAKLWRLFTASSSRVSSVTDLLSALGRCARFSPNGEPAGFVQPESPTHSPLQFEGEDFGWPMLKKRVDDMREMAGREFALWAIRDLRRTSGRPSAPLKTALENQGAHPGLSPYVARIQRGERLDELEAEIRKKPAKDPKPAPAPGSKS